jgi:hypothetical protein
MDRIKSLLEKREKIKTNPFTQHASGNAFVIFEKVFI